MGTRSLTVILNDKGEEFFCMYRQYDGYEEGHGKELKEYLQGKEIVNGFTNLDAKVGNFNGINDLAACLITHFKEMHGSGPFKIGSIYLYPPGTRDIGEEYIYTIRIGENRRIHITTETYDGDINDYQPKRKESNYANL